MKIRFNCKQCGKALKTDESTAGRRVKCPACSELLTIPEPVTQAFETGSDFEFAEFPATRPSRAKPSRQQDDDDESADACEMCGEDLPPEAKRCPACGERRPGFKTGRRRRKSAGNLAGLGKRFLGAMLDFMMTVIVLSPAYALAIMSEHQKRQTSNNDIDAITLGATAGFAFLVGGLALLAVQVWLMAVRSQSIGKFLVKTQVLDYETNQPAGFAKIFLLRAVVNQIIISVPCLGTVYALIDICFIFSDGRRCVHDRIAGTYVANYEA